MTEAEYSLAEGIRRSALWKLKKSPAHFKWSLDHPDSENTAAMVFGAAVHCAVLTPELFGKQYAVTEYDLRTREGKAAKQQALEAGKIILSKDEWERIGGITLAVRDNPYARRLLDGPHETPYFWTDELTGEKCKCRTDAETDIGDTHCVVDLKTCMDASTDQFMRDAVRMGYHVQAAMYSDGVRAATGKDSTFVFIAVEKEPPYALNILQCDNAFMLYGMDEYRYLMGLYHMCREGNKWPAYTGLNGDINALELPAWLKKGVE